MESESKPTGQQRQRFSGLDGLRGLAALLVLLNHMSLNQLYLLPGLDLVGLGKPAVYLFFQLSAFLLTSQTWAWPREAVFEASRWLDYLVARVLRIWPLFLAYVLISLLTTRCLGSYLGGRGLPESIQISDAMEILLLQRGQGSVLWTIPVEFKFYLLLPVITIALATLTRRSKVPSMLLVGIAAGVCFAVIPRASVGASPLPFLGVFLSGVLGAVFHQWLQREPTHIPRRFFEALAWLAIMVLVLIAPSVARGITGQRIPAEYLAKAHVLSSAIWFALILGMLNGTGTMRRLLDSKWLLRLGTISYSLYLWHMTVLQVIVWPKLPLPIGARAWLGLFGAIALATVSYLVIEAPGQRLGSRLRRALSKRGTPSADPASQTARPAYGSICDQSCPFG